MYTATPGQKLDVRGGIDLTGNLNVSSGAEKVTNGDFTIDTTVWTAFPGATLSVDSGHLRVTSNGGTDYGYQQITGLIVGKRYKFSYDYIGDGGGAGARVVYVGTALVAGAGYQAYVDDVNPSVNTHTYYFTATSTTIYIHFGNNGGYCDWDNVILVEAGDILVTGNVGIGTTAPSSPLHIKSGNGFIELETNTVGDNVFQMGSEGGEDRFVIYDKTAAAYRMVVDNSGNVGIGTTNPTSSLYVVGDAIITGDLISDTLHEVSSEGLVLAVNMNSSSINTKVLDASTHNNQGVVTGAVYSSTAGFNGGGAYDFDGNTDYISFGDLGIGANEPVSISFWAKIDTAATSKGSYNTLLANNDSINPILYQHNANNYLYTAGGEYLGFVPTLGIWYHYVLTYEGDTSTSILYVNADSKTFVEQSGWSTNPALSSFALGLASSNALDGKMDDVRVYNRVLSQAEVSELYLQRVESGDSYVSQKNVFVDSNGNVGIGTTSPTSPLHVVGNIYTTANVSALSFTDRTPYPKDLETAYEAVLSMTRLPEGEYKEDDKEKQLDHSSLSEFIKSGDGRDLSATVSAQNEVIKDLIKQNTNQNEVIKDLRKEKDSEIKELKDLIKELQEEVDSLKKE